MDAIQIKPLLFSPRISVRPPGRPTLRISASQSSPPSFVYASIAPGGLGIFDLGWLGLLRLGGVPEAAALAFVVTQRAFVFVFVLVWAGFSALLSLTVQSETADSRD